MALSTRQPFAELGTPRLQALSSAKNRQNALTPTSNFTSPLKPNPTSSTGKRRAPSVFEDELDAENIDPSIFNSPTKKSKTTDGFAKPSKFSLVTSPSKQSISLTASPSIPSVRRALSSPKTTNCTPITHTRGSPKNKRLGALTKRRVSSSPFRRVDPPTFAHSSPSLPFSIDAALSGTIPNYTPKSSTPLAETPSHAPRIEESMPKSWFFAIHEDTPEQEAANLMEHSASVLDISSDDDAETKRRNEDLERGKENIPPPEFAPLAAQPRSPTHAQVPLQEGAGKEVEGVKMPRLRTLAQDAMEEDRRPLGDLPAKEFYGEGCGAETYVTVDPGLERPSGLSKEFEFACAVPEEEGAAAAAAVEEVVPLVAEEGKVEEGVQVFVDENAAPEVPAAVEVDALPQVEAQAQAV